MAEKKRNESEPREHVRIQFNLFGLVIFSVSLIVAAGLLSFALAHPLDKVSSRIFSSFAAEKKDSTDLAPKETPAWGELMTYDVEMERPEEYAAMEINNLAQPTWTFEGMNPAQARKTLSDCGVLSDQIERAFSPDSVTFTNGNTILKPDNKVIFALMPEVRAKLYAELAKSSANTYMRFPFCFPGHSFETIASDSDVDDAAIALVRTLLYSRGENKYFSDFEAVMRQLPDEKQRLSLVKALSRQSAVLARIRIRPTTDIDKLLNYWAWAPGVRFTDLRPLLDSIRQLPDGGSISLLYFLPKFAREHLYTYPLPAQPGDPTMDCHWTSLNFFNETPDNRLSDPSYSVPYIASHYYQIDKPTHYGDVIFLLDEKGQAIHSAVYIADDIVFTKNGNNYRQPWMLMRMSNLLATYSATGKTRTAVYRNRND
jgi:hypothetical protein